MRLRAPPARQPGAARDAIRRHLEAAGLARQKWPEEVRVVEGFPRTPSGKIQKFALRERVRASVSEERRAEPSTCRTT